MNRWERWNRSLMERQEDNLSDLDGNGDEEKKEELPENQDPNSPNRDTEGTSSPFSHPSLKGKSAEEAEALYAAMEASYKSANRRAAELEQNIRTPEPEKKPEPKKFTAEEMWADPNKIVDAVHERIKGDLEGIVAPFKEDLKRDRIDNAWTQLKEAYDDVDALKPVMDEILAQHNIKEPNFATLNSTYIMATGMVAKGMRKVEGREERRREDNGEGDRKPRINPQHQPSSQPPKRDTNKNAPRKLTEDERKVARMQGFPATPEGDAEYLRWLGADEESFLTPDKKA